MNLIELLRFLWSGEHQDFNLVSDRDVSESDLKEGDLILRDMDMDKSPFYHAGIYCGEGEVIDFAGKSESPQVKQVGCISCCSSCMDGKVSKVGLKTFIQEKSYRVLRLKSGIAKGFRERVKVAMNATLKYDAANFNCLYFALNLLGKKQLPSTDNGDMKAMKKKE